MKCEEALKKIDSYVRGTMSYHDMEAFLEHIDDCPSCYDELETIYTVKVGIQYLETDEQVESFDSAKMLREDLEKNRKQIRRRKRSIDIAVFVGLIVIVGIIIRLVL